MSKHFNFFKKNVSMKFSSYFSYRFTTFVQIITDIVNNLLQPLLLFFIYNISKGIPGWSFYELVLFNSSAIISLGLSGSTIMAIIWEAGWRIDNGKFDLLLIRPLKVIPQMLLMSFNPWWLSDLISGFVILFFSIIKGGFALSLLGVITYSYLILLSAGIYFGIAGLIIGSSFKYFKAHKIAHLFWIVKELDKYPLNIYHGFLPFFLTFILPLSLANYYPASFLLGKITDYSMLIPLTAVSLIFVLIGLLSIKWGLKHYTSAGG